MPSIRQGIETSASWIARALSGSGYRADFTAESLWEVDRLFDEHTQNGAAKAGGLLSADLGARLFAVGCYMGEVVRRVVGGEWSGDDTDPEAEINVQLQLPDGSICWPVRRAMKRFKNGAEDGIAVWGLGMGVQPGSRPEPPQRRWLKKIFG